MGMFTKISSDLFNNIQFDAGMLLTAFDPESPATPSDSAILCATTGGVSATLVPSFIDMGEDVDNCPNNMLELKEITGYEATMTATALDMSTTLVKYQVGAADITGNKVTPRMTLRKEDFKDLWWVGDITGGGFGAVHLKNALSTGGFSLQTTKKGKGQFALTLTGHFSIDAQDEVPMEFYVAKTV